MSPIVLAIIGLLAGSGIGFAVVSAIVKKSNQSKLDEINKISDLEVEKARIAARSKNNNN